MAVRLGLAAILAAQGFLFSRRLSQDTFYDEGVYLLALSLLERGAELGTDVFTSQPPGFYELLQGLAFVFGTSVEGVRLGIIGVSLLGAVGAYLAGRALGGPLAGLFAAALPMLAWPVAVDGSRVLSDLPSLWLGLLALGFAATPGGLAAAAAGAAIAGSVFVKLSGVVAVPIVVALVVRRRDRREIVAAVAGALAVTVVLILVHADALPDLWRGAVSYNLAAAEVSEGARGTEELPRIVSLRSPYTWLVAAAAVLALAGALRRRWGATWPLTVWGLLSLALAAWHEPFQDNNLVLAAVPVAVAAGALLGHVASSAHPALAVVLACAVAAGYVQQHRRVAGEYRPEEALSVGAAALIAERTPPDGLVLSDQPIVPFLADRPAPGQLVDTAVIRFQSGYLTKSEVLRVIDERCPAAAVAGRSFLLVEGLPEEIGRRFAVERDLGGLTVYLEPNCAS